MKHMFSLIACQTFLAISACRLSRLLQLLSPLHYIVALFWKLLVCLSQRISYAWLSATECVGLLAQLVALFLVLGHSLLEWRPKNGENTVANAARGLPQACGPAALCKHVSLLLDACNPSRAFSKTPSVIMSSCQTDPVLY